MCGEGAGQCQPSSPILTNIISKVRLLDLKSGIELSSFVSGYNKNYQVAVTQYLLKHLVTTGGAPSSPARDDQLRLHLAGLGVLLPTLPGLAHHRAGPGHLGMWQQP